MKGCRASVTRFPAALTGGSSRLPQVEQRLSSESYSRASYLICRLFEACQTSVTKIPFGSEPAVTSDPP
jgi:hypothetical protein